MFGDMTKVYFMFLLDTPDEVLPQISPPDGSVVDEEDQLTLTCSGDLFDLGVLTWERPGLKATPISSISGTTKTVSLIIKSVRPSDAGVYMCVGWTANDTKSSQVTINVTGRTLA